MRIEEEDSCGDECYIKILQINRNRIGINKIHDRHLRQLPLRLRQLQKQLVDDQVVVVRITYNVVHLHAY